MAREKVQSLRERKASGELEKPTMEAVLSYYGVDHPANRTGWVSILCPFVAEDTPSCRVQLDEGAFLCMSCGASGGDTLSFLMLRDNLTFPEAKALAETIPGEKQGATKSSGRKSLSIRGAGYVPKYKRR